MFFNLGELIKKFLNKLLRLRSSERFSLYKTSLGFYYLPNDAKDDIIVQAMKKGNIFESEIVETAKSYIGKDTTVLDVGSNLGQMSLLFSDFVGKEGTVYSFEADDFIIELLKKNIEVNNRRNIIVIDKAVYDKCGSTMFYPVQDFKRFSSYGSYGLSPQANEGRMVSTITIDSLNIMTPISFMKVDVQGSDLFALKGAVETINRFRMPIIFEYESQFQDEFNTSWQDYIDFIDQINYKIDRVVNGINYLIVPKN